MATLEQIGSALKKAAAAGDEPAARVLAKAYKAMQANAAVQQGAPVASGAAPAPQAGPMDFLTQGMSGINEGIANSLGAPVDLATLLMNGATGGINALTGMLPREQNLSGLVTGQEAPNPYAIPKIEHPFGGSETFKGLLSPTIKPETSDPAQQVTRRVAQEVGAFLIPGMGPVAKSAKPLAAAGRELAAALGSGTGAALAQQVAPGNPLVELGGQLLGGMTPGGVARMAEHPPKTVVAPKMTTDDLRVATDAAYQKTRDLGVAYSPGAYDQMLGGVIKQALDEGISKTRHADAYSFMMDMAKARGKPLSLTELDQLRQRVRRDLITPSYGNPSKAADAHFGEIILDGIDGLISNAKPADMVSGSSEAAANAILQARSLNTRLRKTELIQDAVEKAKLQAAASGSGGNLNNAIRQQVKAILTNPKKSKSFTAAERAAMEDLVKQGKTDDLLRWLGKFSPGGNGLIGALEVVGTLHNPALAAMPVAGMVAKGIADKGTLNKADRLQQMVATGAPPVPLPRPPTRPFLPPGGMEALLAAQAANQTGRRSIQITVPYRAR